METLLCSSARIQVQRLGGVYIPTDEGGTYRERQVKKRRGPPVPSRRKKEKESLSLSDCFRLLHCSSPRFSSFSSSSSSFLLRVCFYIIFIYLLFYFYFYF